MTPAARYGALPFDEQIRFFRQKLNLPTASWTDIWQSEHDHAFVVAGAMRDELVAELRAAVDQVVADGATLQSFRNDFDRIVAAHGWAYNGSRGWRARVIYETNLRTSYQAGRYAQLKEGGWRFWRYQHSESVRFPRPQHQAWDGKVIAADDPWWRTHFPPNGWGCKCYVEAVTDRDMERMGRTEPDQAPPIEWETKTVGVRGPSPRTVQVPKGIDPGWGYAPGESWVRSLTPPALDELLPSASAAAATLPKMPSPRAVSADRVLPEGLPDTEYVSRFLAEFGLAEGDRNTVFMDVTGEPLLINDLLFRDRSGALKVMKRGRERHVLLLADTIREPDEIWEDWNTDGPKPTLRRRYLARWRVGETGIDALSVFETGAQGWVGVTALSADAKYLETQGRRGVRIYGREE